MDHKLTKNWSDPQNPSSEVDGNAGFLPAFFELRTEPFLRHVEPGVDEAVGLLSHIAQEDPGLAVVDLAPGAAVLADHPDRLTPLLGELGGVDRVHGEFRILGPDRFRKLLLVIDFMSSSSQT